MLIIAKGQANLVIFFFMTKLAFMMRNETIQLRPLRHQNWPKVVFAYRKRVWDFPKIRKVLSKGDAC